MMEYFALGDLKERERPNYFFHLFNEEGKKLKINEYFKKEDHSVNEILTIL